MRVGILTRNEESWCSQKLCEAIRKRGVEPVCFNFSTLVARVSYGPKVTTGDIDILKDLGAIIVRPIGRGSLEEIIFRMDVLRRLQKEGLHVINSPEAIEKAVDKYRALAILEENGIPVPRTVTAEDPQDALRAFKELGGDVVMKPLFGSRGVGTTRINDPEIAIRVFNTLAFHHHVIYIQEFVPHGTHDIRAFVLGEEVIASMRRVGRGWKTNVSQGATPVSHELPEVYEDLVVRSAKILGCEMAGVDVVEGGDAPFIVEINSQPGWKGLQSTTKVNIADRIVDYVLSRI